MLSQQQALYYAHLAALQMHQKILEDKKKERLWREREKKLARRKAMEKKRVHLLKHAGKHVEKASIDKQIEEARMKQLLLVLKKASLDRG